MKEYFQLAFTLLEKYNEKEDPEEIIVAFENLKDNILNHYGHPAAELLEDKEAGNILEDFDSRIFEADYTKIIQGKN